jgi:hypothetical protein
LKTLTDGELGPLARVWERQKAELIEFRMARATAMEFGSRGLFKIITMFIKSGGFPLIVNRDLMRWRRTL